jgi:hypothetical protein
LYINDLLYNIDKDDIYYIHIIDKNDKVLSNVSIRLNNLEPDKYINFINMLDIKDGEDFDDKYYILLTDSEFNEMTNSEEKIYNIYNILSIEYEKLIEINEYYDNNFKLYFSKNFVEDINSLDLENQLNKGKAEFNKMLLDCKIYIK